MMNALFSKLLAMVATATSEVMTEAADAVTNFNFEPFNFVSNLKYMAAGMVGIFLVIGAIILTIVVLGKVTAPRKQKEENK